MCNFEVISHKPYIQKNYIPAASAKKVFKKRNQYCEHVHVFLKVYTVSNEQCLRSGVWIKPSSFLVQAF
jgi:hypothetical protein